jgi:hypothetical protein
MEASYPGADSNFHRGKGGIIAGLASVSTIHANSIEEFGKTGRCFWLS